MPAIVLATAVPSSNGPSTLPTAASTTALPGRAARVATNVAIAFAASWTPLVNANANAIAIAATSPVLIGSQCRVARVSTARRPPEPQ